MPFVKLDVAILDSTLWLDAAASRVFLTALLMAVPWETTEPLPQLEVRSLKRTDFVVPPGWYGYIPVAGIGLIRRALVPDTEGYAALEALGAPDEESRSYEFEGRRLVRVDGGYIVLNFMKFRDRDHNAAERQKRYRERKKATGVTHNVTAVTHNITQADADADANADVKSVVGLTPDESLFDEATRKPQPPAPKPEQYVQWWNTHRGTLPAVEKFTDSRRRRLQARIAHGLTAERFKAVVEKVQRTPFCLGDNERQWKVTFDYLIKSDDNVTKILEGVYDRAPKPQPVRREMRDPMEMVQ